jgi:hypothetical protein
VYDNESYAHMIPITSIFSGIESMLNKKSKRIKVKMIAPGRKSSTSKNAHGIWASLKRHVKEHHKSLDTAFAVYYGQGHGTVKQEVWEYGSPHASVYRRHKFRRLTLRMIDVFFKAN